MIANPKEFINFCERYLLKNQFYIRISLYVSSTLLVQHYKNSKKGQMIIEQPLYSHMLLNTYIQQLSLSIVVFLSAVVDTHCVYQA